MSIKLTDLHTSSPVQLYFWIVKTVQNRPRQVGDQRELGGQKGVFCIFEGWYYISKGSNWLGMKIGGTLRFFSSPKYVLVGTKSFCVSSNSFYGDPHCPRAVSTQKVCHSKFFSNFGRLWPRQETPSRPTNFIGGQFFSTDFTFVTSPFISQLISV